ncbi:inorganic phosphate transporter [Picrophilus oshimae]|uniref:Inorganic phosphate transporter, PiT family n=1 Tax=Picrophilus torridus (strain ATCC 700027 / DSM 9790 / JCM 10055 / NBRC 100828 / KAW 2/3) TaxID=1122961 RepID=A0A8G2L7E1_PICTO|nr:inorganic phosphate transporter [Picrophilus oshimae]SMD31017.1 inorganic phosphate transporter, PiT family [Picrophilus oshimae DSM 9789]
MIFLIISLILTFLLTAFVSGNNMSAAVGTLIGSRIIGKNAGLSIGAAGFISGLLLEGDLLKDASSLLPDSYIYVTYAFLISFLIFIIANIIRAPLSLTMALAGTSIGISLKISYKIDSSLIDKMILFWIAAPVISIIISYISERVFFRGPKREVWRTASLIKVLLIISSFFTAFTLGSNTLGFIAVIEGFNFITLAIMIISIITGSFFLSAGVIKRVGQEMYLMRYSNALVSLLVSSFLVEAATFFSVPLSNTQTLTSSVFGVGISYKYKAIYIKPFIIIVMTWIIAPLLGLILGYIA